MTIQQRKSHFTELGKFLGRFTNQGLKLDNQNPAYTALEQDFEEQINMAVHYNGWFTRENVLFSLEQWSSALTKENLDTWISSYNFENESDKTVAIIMAGNIPMVGFHDFLSVLISGHKLIVKQSSNDKKFLPLIARFLSLVEPAYKDKINFTEDRLPHFDAVIATGSNNTARYFEYYFKGKPSIIRKNRNSVAVLTGNESREELEALGEDIFRYFGLGCRNVSKLYVPQGYDFDSFYKALSTWERLLDHAKYANNYDYNKAVYLMSKFKFLDNGFLILKEDPGFGSPIGSVFYETYSGREQLEKNLGLNKENLQCVVTGGYEPKNVNFGQTQLPALWDYADNVDTLAFLRSL
ncbi:acyl-CoA reductase [Antarcticibacterium flavum]|uniref:Acyl-CoA reductase n=1 Tax=Antarcticibacterium flavum TaxID=2058175 RepID=A0A5B7X748_9FLAO|nr:MULTISPECIES: acyl-CoA reductase [Antarcticibacterium]MCM4160326.1 acyl-CoA reductase [Antarcticibacterium sp. W02-3]QCY71294.1 acyl-CoA reductase [Antarcticibacterium flavum]